MFWFVFCNLTSHLLFTGNPLNRKLEVCGKTRRDVTFPLRQNVKKVCKNFVFITKKLKRNIGTQKNKKRENCNTIKLNELKRQQQKKQKTNVQHYVQQ